LGHAKLVGRLREAAALDHGTKRSQLLSVHKDNL
jgi:hypothetical protein